MNSQRLVSLVGAIVFLIIAAISLYRLLFYFEIMIGSHRIGQVATFFALVISIAISMIMFRGAFAKSPY